VAASAAVGEGGRGWVEGRERVEGGELLQSSLSPSMRLSAPHGDITCHTDTDTAMLSRTC